MSFKLPVSVLVVIYAKDTKRVLMLQRRDDPAFWQSVTGSLEEERPRRRLPRVKLWKKSPLMSPASNWRWLTVSAR